MNISQHLFVPFSFSADSTYPAKKWGLIPYAPLYVSVTPYPLPSVLLVSQSSDEVTTGFSSFPMPYVPYLSRPTSTDSVNLFLLFY